MSITRGRQNRRFAFYLGLLMTVLALGAHAAGLLDRLELAAYDVHFKPAGATDHAGDSGRILHIDIDDESLAQIGRWPWPRARLAELVDELTALGAEAIVLDIIMPEPQQARLAASPFGRNYDLVGQDRFLQDANEFIHDDGELARAIRGSGRVLVAMHFDTAPPAAAPDADSPPAVWISDAGKAYVRQVVGRLLDQTPDASAREVAAAIYPSAAQEAGPVQDLIFNCYRQTRALRSMDRCSLPRSASLAAVAWSPSGEAVAPIPLLADAAAGAGFVCVRLDPDGAMRGIEPFMRYGDRVYPQLALLTACRVLDVPLDRVSVIDGELVLPSASQPDGSRADVRVPLDRQRRMLINWSTPGATWKDSFRHRPAHDLLAIARNRQLIAEKDNQVRAAAGLAVGLAFDENSTELADYRRQLGIVRAGSGIEDYPDAVRGPMLESARARMGQIERAAADRLREQQAALRNRNPLPADQQARLRAIDDLAPWLFEPERVEADKAELRAAVVRQEELLRPIVAGRVCFVGSTATGASDFVLSPPFAQCPGVLVHSNILNTILTGRFIRPAPPWLNAFAILLCGLIASLVTAGAGPRVSILGVLATMAAIIAANLFVLFARWHVWMVLAGPLALVVLAWGVIILYRWLTEARQRRWVTAALGSYTSPAVARRISEHPDLLALSGEQRVISCLFTDLKGFTPISERLGPERTVRLLNRYLDRMSEALLRYEATISKFMGDGIFAFFGAPDVQIDHPRRAAAAALDCREELRRFCHELASEGSVQLAMRVGIATGPAIFGNCGSTRKLDYTAIGDTVNLASRLESANKFFGTSILVSGPTADELEPEFLLRPLGRIVVVGKQEAVAVFELVGRLAETAEADRHWADRFAEAVQFYTKRQFAPAEAAFDALVTVRPADRPAALYRDLCRAAMAQPPGEDWTGAIVLGEK